METHPLHSVHPVQSEQKIFIPDESTAPPRIMPDSTEEECRLWIFNFILKNRKEYTRLEAWRIAQRLQGTGFCVLKFSETYWDKYFEGPLGHHIYRHLQHDQEYAVREASIFFEDQPPILCSWSPSFIGRISSIMSFSSWSAVPTSFFQSHRRLPSPSPSSISFGTASSESSMSYAHQTSPTGTNPGRPVSSSAPPTRSPTSEGEICPRRGFHNSEI